MELAEGYHTSSLLKEAVRIAPTDEDEFRSDMFE